MGLSHYLKSIAGQAKKRIQHVNFASDFKCHLLKVQFLRFPGRIQDAAGQFSRKNCILQFSAVRCNS